MYVSFSLALKLEVLELAVYPFFFGKPSIVIAKRTLMRCKKDLFNSKQIIFNVFRDVFHGQNFKKGIICY